MAYYKRNIDYQLEIWRKATDHKPLLIRGARQVGKSTAVRQLGKRFKYFMEVNLEKRTDLHQFFTANIDVKRICQLLSVTLGIPVIPGETLLFIDEIQECENAIKALRYFREDYPELHVIAAGSLLEFALEELPSFGVGRIRSFYLFPFSFNEFLSAQGLDDLAGFKSEAVKEGTTLPEPIHNKLIELLRSFYLVGGMPEAVSTWIREQSFLASSRVHNDILDTYQQDFSKYKKHVSPDLLRQVLRSVALQAGQKFVYAQATRELPASSIKRCLHLLTLAGLITPVKHTAANGLPLGAEENEKYVKYLFLDLGLMQTMLSLPVNDILMTSDIDFVNKGAASEMFAGLEILKSHDCFVKPEMHYWQNTNKGTMGEIDYLTIINGKIIPIEVKAGTQGKMQSLYNFMPKHSSAYGIRSSLENISTYLHNGCRIRVIPIYALSDFCSNASI
ncbi:MAG: ATP-binding protein [Bacteroidaceae bacterium]|nr:ATP-binding protein [Bacteroidaceae bacterium]